VAGRGVRGQGQTVGGGSDGFERGGCAQAAQAGPREGHDRVGEEVDWRRLMPPRGYVALPRRWVVERTFSWLCASAEAFVKAAMIRLMVRRLARG
jgi:hypothetical protein